MHFYLYSCLQYVWYNMFTIVYVRTKYYISKMHGLPYPDNFSFSSWRYYWFDFAAHNQLIILAVRYAVC